MKLQGQTDLQTSAQRINNRRFEKIHPSVVARLLQWVCLQRWDRPGFRLASRTQELLCDLLMLDLVVAGLQQRTVLHVNDGTPAQKRSQTSCQHLQGGKHDALLAVLHAGVHQVLHQAHLRPQVPDSEKKTFSPTLVSDSDQHREDGSRVKLTALAAPRRGRRETGRPWTTGSPASATSGPPG